jgi:hypothetical protein
VDSFAYCTREDVKRALDSKNTARDDAQVDRAVAAGRRAIESLTHRRFYPWTGTRYMDWPNYQYARSWRLWLGSNEMVSLETLVSGGVTIVANDRFLRRSDNIDEAPYTHIEIDLDSAAAFSAGSTHQRSVALTGVFGGCPVEENPAGALSGAVVSTSATSVTVTNSAAIGVGDIIRADSERLIVTDKSMVDTGVNIDAGDSLTASPSDVAITMSTTTLAPVRDEVILIDSERMLVVDVAGSVLTVKRAWDGSVLATHAGSADIYAPRTLTVQRGALGTTAATHLDAATVYRYAPPPLVRDLNIAEAMSTLLQEISGYAREVGSGENSREASGRGLKSLREDVYVAHGRKARMAAI